MSKKKKKELKYKGFLLITLGLLILLYLFFSNASRTENLRAIEGELNYCKNEVIGRKKHRFYAKKSTLISLKNYPNVEFNLGKHENYETILKETRATSKPILVKLNIERIYLKDRKYIPASYGFWINKKEMRSDKTGFEDEKLDRTIFLFIGLFSLSLGVYLLFKSKKRAKLTPAEKT